jgi:hypothetical protein
MLFITVCVSAQDFVKPIHEFVEEPPIYPKSSYSQTIFSPNCKYQFSYNDKDKYCVIDFETRDTLLVFKPTLSFSKILDVASIDEEKKILYYTDIIDNNFCLIKRGFVDHNILDTIVLSTTSGMIYTRMADDLKNVYWYDSDNNFNIQNLETKNRKRITNLQCNTTLYDLTLDGGGEYLILYDKTALYVARLADSSIIREVEGKYYSYVLSDNKDYLFTIKKIDNNTLENELQVVELKTGKIVLKNNNIISNNAQVISMGENKYYVANSDPCDIVVDLNNLAFINQEIGFGDVAFKTKYKGNSGLMIINKSYQECSFYDLTKKKITKRFGTTHSAMNFINNRLMYWNQSAIEVFDVEQKTTDNDAKYGRLLQLDTLGNACEKNGKWYVFYNINDKSQKRDSVDLPVKSSRLGINTYFKRLLVSNDNWNYGDTLYVVDAESGEYEPVLSFAKNYTLSGFIISPNFKYMIKQGSQQSFDYYMLDGENSLKNASFPKFKISNDFQRNVFVFDRDDDKVFFMSENGIACYNFNNNDSKEIFTFNTDSMYNFYSYCFTADRNYIFTFYSVKESDSMMVEIFDINKQKIARRFFIDKFNFSKSMISTNNKYMVLGDKYIYQTGLSSPLDVIDKIYNSSDINIYPNPSSRFLKISSNNFYPQAWIIYNDMGEEMNSGKLAIENSFDINIDALPKGIYWVKLFDGTNSLVKSFIKE